MLIAISEKDPRPIYAQIASEIKRQIHDGSLNVGDELPGVRELADSLNINLHTVRHAYRLLRDQGVIYLRLGQRAKIAPVRQSPVSVEQVRASLVPRINELITEAYHLGLSAEDFKKLVCELLDQKRSGGNQ